MRDTGCEEAVVLVTVALTATAAIALADSLNHVFVVGILEDA